MMQDFNFFPLSSLSKLNYHSLFFFPLQIFSFRTLAALTAHISLHFLCLMFKNPGQDAVLEETFHWHAE